MRKRVAILLLCGVSLAAPLGDDSFFRDVCEFEKHWVLFVNGLAGCPSGTLYGADTKCDPSNRRFDMKEFNQAKRIAKRLFQDEAKP